MAKGKLAFNKDDVLTAAVNEGCRSRWLKAGAKTRCGSLIIKGYVLYKVIATHPPITSVYGSVTKKHKNGHPVLETGYYQIKDDGSYKLLSNDELNGHVVIEPIMGIKLPQKKITRKTKKVDVWWLIDDSTSLVNIIDIGLLFHELKSVMLELAKD